MIGTDGDYNFNRLFLDFHVNTDNKIFLDYPYGIEHLMRSTYSYYKRFKNAFAIKFGTPIFDEKNKNAFSLKAAQAVLDTYENDSVVTLDAERGVNPFSLSNRLLYYLDQHGITATVEHKENLYIYEVNQQLTDNKTIIISAHGYSLYYTEEDLEKQNPAFLNGRGHAMVIVGTTNKDNCIVSS